MPRYVALLRAVNVGGRKRLPMAELRNVVESLGHEDVVTYLQSGNVVFSSEERDVDVLADSLERQLDDRLGIAAPAIVLSEQRLARTVTDNPYPQADEPKLLHAFFRATEFGGPADEAAVATALERAAAKGGRDEAAIASGTLYLHTPDGYGRSELAARLGRTTLRAATGRNWATVTALLEIVSADAAAPGV